MGSSTSDSKTSVRVHYQFSLQVYIKCGSQWLALVKSRSCVSVGNEDVHFGWAEDTTHSGGAQ